MVAVAPPPVGSKAADTIWSVDSIAAVVSALRRRPDGSDAIQAIAQTAWFLAQLAAAAQDDESRGDIAGEEGVLESVADALALAKAPPGGCRGGATARKNAAAAASAVVSELSWTPRVRVVVISELRGGKMSVGLLDGLSAALSMESEAVHSEPEQRDPLDPCELGEHDPRASAMRAVSRLAAADPFLARSLASSLDGFARGRRRRRRRRGGEPGTISRFPKADEDVTREPPHDPARCGSAHTRPVRSRCGALPRRRPRAARVWRFRNRLSRGYSRIWRPARYISWKDARDRNRRRRHRRRIAPHPRCPRPRCPACARAAGARDSP